MKYVVEINHNICVGRMLGYPDSEKNLYEVSEDVFNSLTLPCRAEVIDNGVVFGDVVGFEEVPETEGVEETPDLDTGFTSTEDRISILESDNALLKAQVEAQSAQMDFYEECIVELASVVYA